LPYKPTLLKHQKISPPEHLREYVRYFWTLESNAADLPSKTFKTIADGSPGLIFQYSDQGSFYQFDKKLPPVFLYGQSTRCTEIQSPSVFKSIGVYFEPHVLKSVFGFHANELTDTCIDVGEMAGKQGFALTDQLIEAATSTEQASILSEYLTVQLRRNEDKNDDAIAYVLGQINRSKGLITLKELYRQSGMSERSFERKFQQSVGLSPKLYTRICRFQASLHQLRNNDFQKLSDIAFEQEYSDQSHFIRAFKEFSGFSPNQFQKRSNELIENFPELIS
jgi:AraC-like DNA-binding protein